MTQAASPDIALVTGANKGIGNETARGVAGLGMTVLLSVRDPGRGAAAAADLAAAGGDVRFIHFDVTDPGHRQGRGRLDRRHLRPPRRIGQQRRHQHREPPAGH